MIDDRQFEALNELVAKLTRRQFALEQRVAFLEGKPHPSGSEADIAPAVPLPAEDQSVMAPPQSPAEEQLPTPESVPVAARSKPEPAMETRVGLTVVNRVGVVTLILGVAFFFKWAVDNQWIGPAGRVVLGLLAGFAALGAADYLWRKSQQIFAQGATGAGLAIVYLSAYAAFGFYHLVPQAAAFLFLASVTALGYALALRYNSVAIAVLGFFGGYATPLLLSSGEDHSWFLLSYILLLDLAALRLVREKRWLPLELLAFVATSLLYFVWFDQTSVHKGSLAGTLGALAYYTLFLLYGSPLVRFANQAVAAIEIFLVWQDLPGPFFTCELALAAAGLASALFRNTARLLGLTFSAFWLTAGFFVFVSVRATTGVNFAAISVAFLLFLLYHRAWLIASGKSLPVSTQSLFILASNGTVYYALAYALLNTRYHAWLGLLAVAISGTYVGVAWLLHREFKTIEGATSRSLLVALGMAMAFVTLAIPVQLSGFYITIAWAIQAAALTWIGTRLQSSRAVFSAAALLGLVVLRLTLFEGALFWADVTVVNPIVNTRFFTFAVAAACAMVAARWAAQFNRRLALIEYMAGHAVLLTGLTLEACLWALKTTPAISLLSVETVTVSILWAVYAVAFVGIGVMTRTAINRIAGLILIGFVIVKLYLFDVWQLDRVYRIAAFVALGLLMISTSFLYSRFRPIIESLLKNDEAPS